MEIEERFQAPADFDGPVYTRSCTDVIFAGLLLIAWGVMTGIGIYSWNTGDPRLVIYPMDYDGNICGTDYGGTDMTDYPKLVYINSFGGGVCVKECPTFEELVDPHTLITYNGVYQEEDSFLSPDFVSMPDYSNATDVKTCDSTNCNTDTNFSWTRPGINQGSGYAYYAVDTYQVLDTRCLSNPNAIEKLKAEVLTGTDILDIEEWSSLKQFFGHLYGDIYDSIYYILTFGVAGALVVGFIYAQLLRFQPLLGLMIWGSILSCIAILFGIGAYAYKLAQDWKLDDTQSDFNIKWTKIFSYFMFALGSIVVFLTIFLRKSIMMAMACVREAARAIGSMPLLVAFPIIQTLGFLAFTVIWAVYAVHLASTGTIVELELPLAATANVRGYQFDDFTTYCGWFLLFCGFWTVALIRALGELVVAMSVSKWYFSRDKWEVGSGTLITCIFHSMRYHLGTAAFGSFIIAVTQIIRVIVAKAQQKARVLNNKFGEALLCCCQCCLWCFEKFVKFLNKNAYIQTAIFGTPFCRSAREAFSLIARNVGKIGSISYVSTIVLFVGKFFISCLTTGAAFIYIQNGIGEELYSVGGPLAFIFVISYFIGDMFLDIFDMSTTTILHCFVADEEMFDGDECYAEGELRGWLDDYEESERKMLIG